MRLNVPRKKNNDVPMPSIGLSKIGEIGISLASANFNKFGSTLLIPYDTPIAIKGGANSLGIDALLSCVVTSEAVLDESEPDLFKLFGEFKLSGTPSSAANTASAD